jgi:aminoglycoside phosphotransferase (APT) family kinase protein
MSDDATAWRQRAERSLRRRYPPARLEALSPLEGGISSLTFASELTGTGEIDGRVVVKVAPPGLAPVRNRDVLRQARVLEALRIVPGVEVPGVLACDDGSPPLFVMTFVTGEAHEPTWDLSDDPPAPAVVRARAFAAARMLAQLQAAEPMALGLGDEPALTPLAELERWSVLYATAGDDLRRGEAALARALEAAAPEPLPPRVLHGDYRLGNMQFAGERLAAIIDWEIWSVGDPRADLAWLMLFADPGVQRVTGRDARNQAAADAMPEPQELLDTYVEAAGLTAPPEAVTWFQALGTYKLGATMAVLAKRNRRRPDPDPSLELAAVTTPPALERALELLRHPGAHRAATEAR